MLIFGKEQVIAPKLQSGPLVRQQRTCPEQRLRQLSANRRLMQRSKERGYSTTSAAMIVPL